MKVIKEKQYLVFKFDKEDNNSGKTVKYNLETKETIGLSGKVVKNLKYQLSGYTIDDFIKCCENKNYAKFLEYVYDHEERISNIGTLLERSNEVYYRNVEQLISAGLKFNKDCWQYTFNDIPKSLIKRARETGFIINKNLVKLWKENPNDCDLIFDLDYTSLDKHDVFDTINLFESHHTPQIGYTYVSYFDSLINNYGYKAKTLFLYLDRLKTFEALNPRETIREVYDYANMMSRISRKFDKYPRHFLTTHAIASRNYNRLKIEFDEIEFSNHREERYECDIGGYSFIYPKTTQDIKDEAVQQNNCVASYIKRVLNGDCHILFMRRKDEPEKSHITLEVVNNQIVQAKRRFNYDVSDKEKEVIEKWNRKFNVT